MNEEAPSTEGPITVVARRCIKQGREREYEAWLAELTQALSQIPGYQGSSAVPPQSKDDNDSIFIPRFDGPAAVRRWQESPERAALMETLQPLLADETKFQKLTGLEFWFTPPAGHTGQPARWKMVIVTFLVMYPLSTLILQILRPIMAAVPPLVAPLIMMGIMIPIVTYMVMPLAMKAFARWLFPAMPKAGTLRDRVAPGRS